MSAQYAVAFAAATNADLAQAFVLTTSDGAPLPLNAATLAMAIEAPPGSGPIVADTTNGRISITDPAAGAFELRIPAAVLGQLQPGVYRHDLVLTRAGTRTRIWSGHVTLEAGIVS